MTQQMQGVLRPLALVSSRVLMFVLLAALGGILSATETPPEDTKKRNSDGGQ